MKSKINLSLLILTHNESKNLQDNFGWVKSCKAIKEIVIIDDNSTDNTIETAKKINSSHQKIKVIQHSLNNDFAQQRNFGISQTNYNWILTLDADEKPTQKLIRFLSHFDRHQYKSYAFKRQDIFLGHKLNHGENAFLTFTRLFNKNYGKFVGQVHEVWQSHKDTKQTKLTIQHFSHQTIKTCIQKINFYTDIRSQEMYAQQKHTNMAQIIFLPIGKFIGNYFIKLGFLDGTPGIIMALCMSFHVFLNKAKLWHLYRQQS